MITIVVLFVRFLFHCLENFLLLLLSYKRCGIAEMGARPKCWGKKFLLDLEKFTVPSSIERAQALDLKSFITALPI